MEMWKKVWREGVLPLLSQDHLEAIRDALMTDDPRLMQGGTTTPPPLQCVMDWPVEAVCLLALPGMVDCGGWGQATVVEVEERFGKMCFDVDNLIGETAGCRWLLNWYDETPRDEMRRLLLPEVERGVAMLKDPVE